MNISSEVKQIAEMVADADGVIVIAFTNHEDGESVNSLVFSTTNIEADQCIDLLQMIAAQKLEERRLIKLNLE